ncbi:MAG TPA: DUF11 domain-containing protein, partial [Nitriliruptorales bacterium]|nr:DUF11 domain-containing protein [Nitriliruptorales bacterium]
MPHRLFIALTAALVAFLSLPTSAATGATVLSALVHFEGLSGFVSEVSSGSGVGGDPIAGSIKVDGVNPSHPGVNAAMIFDATCGGGGPGDCTGGDSDLFKPQLGNVLIVSEDLDPSDPDDADLEGSALHFDFSGFGPGLVNVVSLDLLDVEADEPNAVIETSREGATQTSQEAGPTGDNQLVTVPVNATDVDTLHVVLNGSGAIANIRLQVVQQEPEVEVVKSSDPAPGTTLEPDDELTYTVSVTETTGLADAADVAVSDTLDAGVSLVSVDGCDSVEAVGGAPGPTTLTCHLDTVAAGSTRTFTITVTVGDGADACDGLTNVASTDFEDEDADNNTSEPVTNPVTCGPPEPGEP